jgi:hypothetical protein
MNLVGGEGRGEPRQLVEERREVAPANGGSDHLTPETNVGEQTDQAGAGRLQLPLGLPIRAHTEQTMMLFHNYLISLQFLEMF